MVLQHLKKINIFLCLSITSFITLAIYLCFITLGDKVFTETNLIYNTIWLDAWSFVFILVAVIISFSNLKMKTKLFILLGCFSLYGLIVVRLIFDGTPFSVNAYWGDQKFRIAMILKFAEFGWFTDFYYKNMPPFYPPLFYWSLAKIAQLFSFENLRMLKIADMIIYFFGPPVLFYFWSKLVSSLKAFCITIATYLFCSFVDPQPFYTPHAFLADSFFIPWWLYFVEQINNRLNKFSFYLTGGIIGGALFMTYFYSFFIGGFLLVCQSIFMGKWKLLKPFEGYELKKSWGIILSSAIFSSPYWIPLFWSIVNNGADRSRGGWHHLGSTGFSFPFLEFSIPGILFILGLLILAKKYHKPLNLGIILLLVSAVIFYCVGSITGAWNISLNIAKVRQLLNVYGGVVVGLLFANLFIYSLKRKRFKPVFITISLVISAMFLQHFVAFAKSSGVKSARTTNIPTWNTDYTEMESRAGKVFLTGYENVPSFYPVYTFLSANEHYAHPASRYIERYNFLFLLQEIKDPLLFHFYLKNNKFEPVDYFMPDKNENSYFMYSSLSNYPNKYTTKVLNFNFGVVADTNYFQKEKGNNLYLLKETVYDKTENDIKIPPVKSVEDSLIYLAKLRLLAEFIKKNDLSLINNLSDWSNWRQNITTDKSNKIKLLASFAIDIDDTTYFIFAFQPAIEILEQYRIFLHIYEQSNIPFANYDFAPSLITKNWNKWDIVWCCRKIPKTIKYDRFHIGFFKGERRLDEGSICYPGPLRIN